MSDDDRACDREGTSPHRWHLGPCPPHAHSSVLTLPRWQRVREHERRKAANAQASDALAAYRVLSDYARRHPRRTEPLDTAQVRRAARMLRGAR